MKYYCKACDKYFRDSVSILIHNKHIHQTKPQQVAKAPSKFLILDQRRKPEDLLIADGYHSETGLWHCNHCEKRFKIRTDLENHLKFAAHNAAKLFNCPVCHKGFSNLASLAQHQQKTMHSETTSESGSNGSMSPKSFSEKLFQPTEEVSGLTTLARKMIESMHTPRIIPLHQQPKLQQEASGSDRFPTQHFFPHGVLYFSGRNSSNSLYGGCSWLLTDPTECVVISHGTALVQQAYPLELRLLYEALLSGLECCLKKNIRRIDIRIGSEMMYNQLQSGRPLPFFLSLFRSVEDLLQRARELCANFQEVQISYISPELGNPFIRRLSDNVDQAIAVSSSEEKEFHMNNMAGKKISI